ncbi:endonuclease/exonuclease/phosphatase family protein [Isoptericola sp. b408]|uniref:endonuclease/exonuclease/phosphatase family protein n=1 Tax=Isoptericola sp. b408 TaxID=3064653 RepID=UPI0027125CDB|nr:endonuclease/exonuclease/phosphatase family protein [Isoptericola sp. b408]MDO8150208.1 endonuclease/exonuclease/phosphatase family protein [Isoptericola sp. b408]
MRRSIPTHRHPRVRALLAAVGVALLAAVPLAPAQAAPGGQGGGDDLVVMTQNLYVGTSLDPALDATTPEQLLQAVAQMYATVEYTNFPARAQAIADEIAAKDPDLIGLQEVARWTTTGVGAGPGYDFLAILQTALEERGLDYSVAAVSDNASIGPVPLALPGCLSPAPPFITCTVQLDDRDVILVNDETPGLRWDNPRSGQYVAQAELESQAGPLTFDRGWASIDGTLHKKPFRFVTTHLEIAAFPDVQEAQAAELLAGPARGGTVIAAGDFNSAADGSTTTTYAQLTAPGQLRDAWDEDVLGAGFTCCQRSNTPPLAPGALNNPVSTLDQRIDLVLGRGAARSDGSQAELVGDFPFQGAPPFWPSDHAGVVAEFRL